MDCGHDGVWSFMQVTDELAEGDPQQHRVLSLKTSLNFKQNMEIAFTETLISSSPDSSNFVTTLWILFAFFTFPA